MKSKLVFLVGCPRSGTTLLQSLLASHPEIFSLVETKFFEHVVPMHEKKRYLFGIASRQAKGKLNRFFDEINYPEYKERLPKGIASIGHYTRSFFDGIDGITCESGKSIFLEKTPAHLKYLKYIERHLPNSKVIHIVRDGRDVVASFYDLVKKDAAIWGSQGRNLDYCIDEWLTSIQISSNYKHKKNHIIVSYEKLILEAEATLKKLCYFLELDFSDQMISAHKYTSKNLKREREYWKSNVEEPIQDTRLKKFSSIFSSDEQRYICQRISKVYLNQSFI
jgi:hypothetical protein